MILGDQVAIVTGGSGGIGEAIVRLLSQEKAKVVIFGRNAEKGKVVAAREDAQFLQVDVTDAQAVDQAVKAVIEEHGQVDILVNNAGVTRDNLLVRMKDDDWDVVLNTNLKACFQLCRAVYRPMLRRKSGRIVNIGSIVGLTGNAGQVNYSASKSGMIGLTKSLARELARKGISVNCVAPGYIQTQMTESLSDAVKKEMKTTIPMGRMGMPEDVAGAVLFLVGPQAAYVTGQVIAVDGGMAM